MATRSLLTPPPEVEWDPAQIFAEKGTERRIHKDFAVVVLNQQLELSGREYTRVWDNSIFQIAADGGANRLMSANLVARGHRGEHPYLDLDVIIGDLDSLTNPVREYWEHFHTEVIHDGDQYSTDFMKAVNYIRSWSHADTQSHGHRRAAKGKPLPSTEVRMPPRDIVCIGGIGGRVDQGLSQLHHLYMYQSDPEYLSGRMFLLSSSGITFVLKTGQHRIHVQDPWLGKHIGIIPMKEPSTITTKGLEWDVTDWFTSFGGQMSTSNHVREEWVTIKTTNDVLFTVDLADPSPITPPPPPSGHTYWGWEAAQARQEAQAAQAANP